MKDEEFFSIEYKSTYYGNEYRYRSLYNGAVGSWCTTKEKAKKEGIAHARIIKSLSPSILKEETE